jgi:glycosyltransferase involved in cell wall biosynthesis
MKNKCYVIIPSYNEEANIGKVVEEWYNVVANIGENSRLVVIDGGSKDETYKILQSLSLRLPQLIAIQKNNYGYGVSVLYGYKYALENRADWVFQTDSDGQTDAKEFWRFWHEKDQYSALFGLRNHREDGISRIFVTKVLKIILRWIFGLNVPDANVPFRLIKGSILQKHIIKIPNNFNMTNINIILAVSILKYENNVRFFPITFKKRQGGVNSIVLRKIIKIGIQGVKDFRRAKNIFAKEK